jgi:hypothetical protein
VTQNYVPGRPQNDKDALGNRYNVITVYAYDARGNQIAVKTKADVEEPYVVTRTYYDALARPVSVVQNLVGQDIWVASPQERDNPPSDRNCAQIRYLGNGNMDYLVDEMGKITDYSYDAAKD